MIPKFKQGATVKVVDSGWAYNRYEEWAQNYLVPADIANWKIGVNKNPPKHMVGTILIRGEHANGVDMLYAIRATDASNQVYIIGEKGIELTTDKNEFKCGDTVILNSPSSVYNDAHTWVYDHVPESEQKYWVNNRKPSVGFIGNIIARSPSGTIAAVQRIDSHEVYVCDVSGLSLFRASTPKTESINSKYPHTCPYCKAPAWRGGNNNVDCSNNCI